MSQCQRRREIKSIDYNLLHGAISADGLREGLRERNFLLNGIFLEHFARLIGAICLREVPRTVAGGLLDHVIVVLWRFVCRDEVDFLTASFRCDIPRFFSSLNIAFVP